MEFWFSTHTHISFNLNTTMVNAFSHTGSPQRGDESERGDGTLQGLAQSGGPGGVQDDDLDAARIPVDSSEFQLIEQTQRPGWEGRISQGPVDAIGVRGYKLLEVLRAQARQQADGETGVIPDTYITTVRHVAKRVMQPLSRCANDTFEIYRLLDRVDSSTTLQRNAQKELLRERFSTFSSWLRLGSSQFLNRMLTGR